MALLSIVLIDLVLAGDNAIVIGLAARNVQKEDQKKVILGYRRCDCDSYRGHTSRCTALNDPRLAIDRWLCPVVDCLQADGG